MQHAAIYCRLSREDGDNIESSSIASQKKFLTEYATKNGYKIFDTYIDDGYSGTDFDRPDFKRMISDVEKGFIDVVIVKDLSRLGRNYLKSGYYLEEYFPAKNVKFIAINDAYDSSVGDNEFAPFKNLNFASGIETNYRDVDQNPLSRKLYFTPTLKINDHLTLSFLNKYNVLTHSSDHDLGFYIAPFKNKAMDFKIFTGITKETNGAQSQSASFYTNFYFF
jgi:hypothetical protein